MPIITRRIPYSQLLPAFCVTMSAILNGTWKFTSANSCIISVYFFKIADVPDKSLVGDLDQVASAGRTQCMPAAIRGGHADAAY